MNFFSTLFGKKKKKENVPISRPPEEPKTELPVPRENIPITQKEKESKTELRVPGVASLPPDTPLTLPKEPIHREIVAWKPGDVILDHYDVERIITSGGMGTVYITNHRNWKVKVAIKSPHKEMLDHPSLFQMVVKEAEAWTDLGLHPNIAYCYFVRNIDNIPHIFVEYVEGGNLREWIEEGRCNDLKTGLDLAIQFCHGMAYAHSKGMIHKDIKPGNILMTKDGILKVTDFGLVQRGTDKDASPILYSEPYASPEQMSGAPVVAPESDVYSFGVCLWEMFLGRRPRPNAWNKAPLPDPKTIDSSLPDALARLLREIVDLDRNTRIALGGFDALKEQFKTIYQNLFHEPSAHSELEQVDLKADGLNNRAISYLELRKEEEAIQSWEEALKADPQHLESTFNYGYHRWNKGKPYRDVLEAPMVNLETTHSSNPDYWRCLAWIHYERGDVDEIEKLQASEHRVNNPEFLKALEDPERPVAKFLRRFEGIDGGVDIVAFSPDGKQTLSVTNKFLLLWETHSGREVRRVDWHTDGTSTVVISPDGKYALLGGKDIGLYLWEIETGREIRRFKGHTDAVASMAISQDGKHALSGSYDKSVRLWEIETGNEIRWFEGHTDAVTSVAISQDGKYALSGSFDKSIRLWDVETGKEIRRFEGHTDAVTSLAISQDGKYALSGSRDKSIRLWDVETGKEIRQFEGHTDAVTSVAISQDGKYALSGSYDKSIRLWNVETGNEIRRFEGHSMQVTSVAFSPSGEYALSGGWDSTVRLWNISVPAKKFLYYTPYPALCSAKSFQKLASEKKEAANLLSAAEAALQKGIFHEAYHLLKRVRAIPGWERDRTTINLLNTCAIEGNGKRISLNGAWYLRALGGHTKTVSSVCFSPDSRYALSGGVDHILRLWEIETGRGIRRFEGHNDAVTSVVISSDGKYALSGGNDKSVRLWEIETGKEIRRFEGHTDAVTSVVISPDGKYALSGGRNATLRLWEIGTGKEISRFERYEPAAVKFTPSANPLDVANAMASMLAIAAATSINALAFSPDGKNVLSGGGDKTVRLWELETGKEIRRFTGHDGEIKYVAFSPHGGQALSGCLDNTIRIWDLETGKEIRRLTRPATASPPPGNNVADAMASFFTNASTITCAAISPDGKYALGGSGTPWLVGGKTANAVILWDTSTGRVLYRSEGDASDVHCIAFSNDGRYGLSAGEDKIIMLWEFDWEWEFPGEEHIDLSTVSMDQLAELLKTKGLNDLERMLGKGNPDTVVTMNKLAGFLHSKGDTTMAELLYRRAIEVSKLVLGKDHPNTFFSLNNLAVLLSEKKDYAGAEPLFRLALENCERIFGKDDPNTLNVLNGLAITLYHRGDYATAEPYFRRALIALNAVRLSTGKQPSNFESFLSNWVVCLEAMGLSTNQIQAKAMEILNIQ